MTAKKVVLMILDGWGIGNGTKSDAIAAADTSFYNKLIKEYNTSTLLTYGEHVGLPKGQMGNSEVGHLNIGAGRIVYQDLLRINRAIEDKSIDYNKALQDAFTTAKERKCNLHFIGLVSSGGVHSSQEHLHYLCDLAKESGLDKVYVHAFTDGRDTDPQSGAGYLEKHLASSAGELVSIVGRYYAMDRDKRWERIKVAYDMLLHGTGKRTENVLEAVQESYKADVTDEFILPIVKSDKNGSPIGRIQPNDVVICFNFRTDRCREITQALTQQAFPEHDMSPIPLYYVTMTNYDDTFRDVHVMFDKENLRMTLGEVVSISSKKQIRIAETEKYPHVTFFFSGGREKEFEGESRILVNSPKVATYDLQPEMSAPEVTKAIVDELAAGRPDFVCLNFANPDMVGHTGVYKAVVKAVETVDKSMQQVIETGLQNDYSFIVIADHGNADFMINHDGTPNTAHSKNLVPCILVCNSKQKLEDGILADVAPTILDLMGLEQPEEMTGKSLLR